MGRQPCCDKIGLKRGPWTIEEDHKLMNFILNNGIQCWRLVPKLAGKHTCNVLKSFCLDNIDRFYSTHQI